jgi:hypothetical protein
MSVMPPHKPGHVLETIKRILSNAGGSLKDVTFNHIFYDCMIMRDQSGLCGIFSR